MVLGDSEIDSCSGEDWVNNSLRVLVSVDKDVLVQDRVWVLDLSEFGSHLLADLETVGVRDDT